MRDFVQRLVQHIFRSLSARIALFLFLLSFCSVMVLGTALYQAYARLVIRSTSVKLEAIRNVCVDRLRNWTDEKHNDLAYLSEGIAELDAASAADDRYRAYLERYVKTHTDTRSIILLDVQGHVEYSSLPHEMLQRGQDCSSSGIFRRTCESGKFCASVIPALYGEQEFMFALAMPFCMDDAHNASNRVTGVMVLEIDSPFLSSLFNGRTGLSEPGDELVIFDPEYRSINPQHWTAGLQRTLSPDMAGGDAFAPVVRKGFDYWGKPVLAAAERVPNLNWGVVVNRPLAQIEQERQHALLTGLALLPVVLLILAVISILLARSITEPLHQIYRAVERFHRGDLSARINLERTDEIGTLAAMIDATTTGVQSKIDQLVQFERALICERDNLEQVIADRTAVLRTREEQFKTIADYTVNWELWLSPSGQLIWTNKVCYTLTGYTVDEFLAAPDFWQLVSAQVTTAQFVEHLKGALRGEIGHGAEFCCRHKNGTLFWVSASWGPVYNEDHQFLGIRASVEDVTHVRRVRLDLEQLAKAMDYAADGMVIASAKGIVLYVNRACETICGYTREEMLGKRIDLFYNDDGCNQEAVTTFMAAMARGLQWSGNLYNRRKDGTPYVLATTASPIMDRDGKLDYFVSNRRDITEALRKQLQRQRLAQVVEQSSVGIAIADCDGRIDYANQQFFTMLGRVQDDVLGRPLSDFYGDAAMSQDMDISVDDIERLRKRGEVWNGTIRRRHAAEGSLVTTTSLFPILDDAKKTISYVLANQDVTDIVAHEAEILVLQESLKQSIDAILIVNAQRRVVFANEAFYTLFHVQTIYPDTAALFADVMHAVHVTLPETVLSDCLTQGRVWRGTTHGSDAQGNARSIELFVSPIFDKRGAIVNSVISIRDITQEAKLREQNHCLAQVVLQSRDSVVIYDAHLRLVYANDAFLELYGFTQEEVRGRSALDIFKCSYVSDDNLAAHQAIMDTIANRDSWHGEVVFRRKDGVIFTVQTIVYPVYDETGALMNIVEVKRNITAELEAKQQLRLLHDALKQSNDAVAVRNTNNVMVYANDAFLAMFGIQRDEVVGKTAQEFYQTSSLTEQIVSTHRAIMASIAKHEPWKGQVQNQRKDGTLFTTQTTLYPVYNHEGSVVNYVEIKSDITEQLRYQEERERLLHEERQAREEAVRLASIIEQTTTAFLIMDAAGKVIFVNPAFCAINGVSAEDCLARDYGCLPLGERFVSSAQLALLKLQYSDQVSDYYTRAWDAEVASTIHVHIARVKDADGVVVNYLASFWDVSEERRLQERAQRLSEVVELSKDAIIIANGAYVVHYINSAYEAMTGYSYAEVVGHRDWKFFNSYLPIKELSAMRHELNELPHGQVWRREMLNCNCAGHVFREVVEVQAVRNQDDKISHYIIIRRDITAEYMAKEESLRLSHIVEQSSIPIVLADSKGLIVYLNNTYTDLMGFSKEELLGRRLADTYADDARYGEIKTALDNKGVWYGQSMAVRKDTRTFVREDFLYTIKDKEGTLAYIAVNSWDVTQEREAQNEISRLAQVIEQSTDAIMIVTVDGEIIYVNNHYIAMFGYAKDELFVHTLEEVAHSEIARTFNATIQQHMVTRESWCGRLENCRKDGTSVMVDVNLSPIYSCANVLTYYVVQQRDATQLIELEMQVQHAQKMESIGRLSSVIAHDFNNMLQGILGFTELLKEDVAEHPHLLQTVNGIEQTTARARALTRQLLTFSRKQVYAPVPVLLSTFLSTLESLLSSVLGKDVELIVTKSSSPTYVMADPSQIEQVIINLAVNAHDAKQGDRRLRIEVAQTVVALSAQDHRFPLEGTSGQFACIAIADNGSGIPAALLSKIFDPFFTTKPKDKGTGLGLAVAYGIIKSHGGWLDVESTVGTGTTFRIYLPLINVETASASVDASSAAIAHKAAEGEPVKDDGHVILVVEDEEVIRKLASKNLIAAGYRVLVAETHAHARDMYRAHAETIDVLFSDVILPDGNGVELADAIRRENPNLPVVLCSGYAREVFKGRSLVQDGYRFLSKPYTLQQMLSEIKQAVGTSEGCGRGSCA